MVLVLVLAVTCMLSGMDEEHRLWRFALMYLLVFFGLPLVAFIAGVGLLFLLVGGAPPALPRSKPARQSDHGEVSS